MKLLEKLEKNFRSRSRKGKISVKKSPPLKWSMVGTLLLCWLMPLMLITFCLLFFVSSMISGQIEKSILISTDKAVEICEMQMDEVITDSKSASYDSTIRDSFLQYKKDERDYRLYNSVTNYLNREYKYNRNYLCTVLLFLEEPDNFFFTYNTYQENNSGKDGNFIIKQFEENALETILGKSEKLDTGTEFVMIGNNFYLIRNLMSSSFAPYAMIIIELSPAFVFDSLNSVWAAVDYEIFIDGKPVTGSEIGKKADTELLEKNESVMSQYLHDGNLAYSYKTVKKDGQRITFLIELDSKMIIDDLAMLRYLFFLVLIFLIPLVVLVFLFFHAKVTKPVASLIGAAREITAGNYGFHMEGKTNSQEFEYLEGVFNAMSDELKYQFEKIFLEELALKDANIMALQSQINPHFLNNTLEIINWEARMNGNEKVCNMIEALDTMLNATMNRQQKRFHTLAEELAYVDAYLYIIGQRFGERFQVERVIDKRLMKVEVPMLIIQPIVENAVEHGMAAGRVGKVCLHIYEQDERMYIEVTNNAPLTEENRKKIECLLGERNTVENERHVSLGIRNVNQRVKIIYGDECGLTVKSDNKNQTVSTIIVKLNNDDNNKQ